MSFDLRDIREISNEPQSKFVNQISKKLSKFLNSQQTDKLESKEDIYSAGQDIDTVIKFHSELSSTNYFDFSTQYFPPFEPDGDKVKAWVRGTNLGNELRDWAERGRNISLHGDALLVDGAPFDDGIHTGGTKSIALRFNRPTSDNENEEDISIESTDPSGLEVEGISTGVSYFLRVRLFDVSSSQNGIKRTLLMKRDGVTPTHGVHIFIDPINQRLVFLIKRSGIVYIKETAAGTLANNTVYDIWCTYAAAGNVQHVYINNVDMTLSTSGYTEFWNSDTTDVDMYIFSRGGEGGHIYGDLYDARMYREKVVSSTEVGYFNTNKWTIVNIPYGAVMLSDYWATYLVIGSGFTTTGYTTIGYDT